MKAARGAAPRAGFVLAELIVAMVIAALIGVALVQLVVSQSRFVSLQSSYMQARGGARAGRRCAAAAGVRGARVRGARLDLL